MIKVLNEENHALKLLEEGFILENKIGYELSVLAKYYIHRIGINRPQTKEKLIDFCTNYIPRFDAVNWRDTINRSVENGKKLNFINVEYINITEVELEKITSIKSVRGQKIMFVLLVIAKLNNKINRIVYNQKNNSSEGFEDIYYVNDTISSIVKLSKTSLKSDERYKILKELQDLGFIKVTTKGKFEVLIVNNDSGVKLHITRVDDFIYDYLQYTGTKIKACEGEGCNKRIIVKGKRDKYCKECRRIKELEKYRKYNKNRN